MIPGNSFANKPIVYSPTLKHSLEIKLNSPPLYKSSAGCDCLCHRGTVDNELFINTPDRSIPIVKQLNNRAYTNNYIQKTQALSLKGQRQ